MRKTKERKKNQGITLISLVITIIVLLLLAGISITMLTSQNGILIQAQNANVKSKNATELERVNLAVSDANIEKISENKELTKEILQKAFDNEFGAGEAIISDKQSDGSFIATINDNEYIIDNNNTVAKNDIEKVNDVNPGEFSGEGTQTNPYLIESIEDIVNLATNVNNGENYKGKYFKLKQNLDFNSVKSYADANSKYLYNSNKCGYEKNESGTEIKTLCTTGEGFITIGREADKAFSGIFDGNNCTIKNLYINIENIPTGKDYEIGLFGMINDNEIKNLSVTGKITTAIVSDVGGIVGYANNNNTSVTIENCKSAVNISHNGDGYVGGIAGCMYGSIKKCTNIGNIESKTDSENSSSYVGGIAGFLSKSFLDGEEGEILSNCINKGNVYVITKGNSIYADVNTGGIVGYNNDSVIDNCINYANVYGKCDMNSANVGGVTGYNSSENAHVATVKKCQNNGSIKGESNKKDVHIGGISGYSEKTSIVEESTNYGKLEGIASNGTVYKDNIVGKTEI